VTHEQYVASVLRALEAEPEPVVLVGHSFGGSVISRVAELRPERCRRLVYYSAFVPRDGERVADSLPAEMLAFIDGATAASADRSTALP
jgi:pimeloyl-ACP methyl ester carboxylesterase